MKNQYVSYAGHGIGQVIETKVMNGVEFLSFIILGNDLKIMVPKGATDLYRPLMSQETATQVRTLMEFPNNFTNDSSNLSWKRRLDKLWAKFKSNNPILLAEIVAELNNRKYDGELSFGERGLLQSAKHLLVAELELIRENNN